MFTVTKEEVREYVAEFDVGLLQAKNELVKQKLEQAVLDLSHLEAGDPRFKTQVQLILLQLVSKL